MDVAVHSRSSNIYGLLDNDDMFQYLGGLAMAVPKEPVKSPHTLITNQRAAGQVKVEDKNCDQTYEVYVKNKYGLELKEFFSKASP